jgi:RimJ/RimL family protein N-acetyltransferase
MRIKNEKTAGKIPCRIHLPVAQLDNATDSDSGEWGFKSLRAGQKRTPYGVSFFGLFRIRRDLKPTIKKMPLCGIFREERLWRHSYAQDATSEAESLGLYKVLWQAIEKSTLGRAFFS